MKPIRHFISTKDLDSDTALALLDSSTAFYELSQRSLKKAPTLRGKTVLTLFFENSTRTRTSFELAGKRLSADLVNISVATSSAKKGETLRDTLQTLDAMQLDCIVVRHSSSGAAQYLAENSKCAIVNAGDGLHEHPTQALLDAFTIRRHKGDFRGLKVCITGDILHSRVARSNAYLLKTLGAEVTLAGPRSLVPEAFSSLGCRISHNIDEALAGADVVMMLRIQQERLGGSYFPNLSEYHERYGLNERRLKLAASDAIVMHPGPMNRGVEITGAIADGPQSVVLDQVEAGVAVRAAVLYHCCGSDSE